MDNSEKKPAVDAEKEHSAEYWKAKCLAQKDEVAQTRKELQDLKDFVKLSQQTFQEQISVHVDILIVTVLFLFYVV
eukprot:m.13666 g.13666  ORF g.13666 m.13666 type:complete len:76 (-) comp4894_c0_seq2:106-333(-)